MTEADRTPNARSPLWFRYRWLMGAVAAVVVAVVVAVVLFIALCDREPSLGVNQVSYWPDDNALMVTVDYCAGSYATGVVETDETVSFWIYQLPPINHGDNIRCLDGVEIPLKAPLGDRRLINGRTGDPFPNPGSP